MQAAGVNGFAPHQHFAPANPAAFLILQAVFHAAQGLAHGAADPLLQPLAHLHAGDGGLRHAEAADGVIAKSVEQLQLLLRRVAAAQNDALDLRAQHAFGNAAEEDLLRQPQARLRRDPLQVQAEILRRGEQRPFQAALPGHLLAQGGAEVVGQKRHGHHQLRLEAAGGFDDGRGGAVPQVDVGIAQKAAPQQIDHEAQHVMEGQKRQRTAVGFFYNAAVFLIDQLGVEHLLGDGFAVVDEDLALARGAAGAQGHALAERAGAETVLRFGGRLLRQRGEIQRLNGFRQAAPPLGDNGVTVGLPQKPQSRIVGAGRVDQQGVVAGEDHAPEQGEPLLARVHGDGDITLLRKGPAQAGGVLPGHGLILAVRPALFLAVFQKKRSVRVPMAAGQAEQGFQRFGLLKKSTVVLQSVR